MGSVLAGNVEAPGADPRDRFKKEAALQAVADEVRDGMVVGLGSGTTAAFVVEEIGRLVRDKGLRIRGVPTSEGAAAAARCLGITLTTLEEIPDVTIDGADQVDPALNLVKGGGGAHVREKVVALSARRFVVVADSVKLVERLRGPIPLEVLPFALPWVRRVLPDRIHAGEHRTRQGRDGQTKRSDNGNLLADVICGPLDDPAAVAATLDGLAGIVGHGLFIGIADVAYIAGPGGLRRLEAPRPRR